MFEMTNYKSGPYSVGCFWAAKAVMHYRDRRRQSWYEDSVEPDGDFEAVTEALAGRSQLIRAMQQQHERPSAVRMISEVSRGPERQLRSGVWVLVQQDGVSIVACIAAMLEARLAVDEVERLVVRLWCTHCAMLRRSESEELWSEAADLDSTALLRLESVHITVVTRVPKGSHNVYVY